MTDHDLPAAEVAQAPVPENAATQPLPPWRRAPERLSARASPRRYDWPLAAKLLAAGRPAEEVAAALGCDEARVWRHLRASPTFRAMVEKEAERSRLLHGLRLQAMRRDYAEALYSRADLAPEAVARLVAEPPEVTGRQLAQAARRAAAPPRKLAVPPPPLHEQQNSQALQRANQIMRDVAAARRELRAAMAPAPAPAPAAASPSPAPVTKTPQCPGSPAKHSQPDAKHLEEDGKHLKEAGKCAEADATPGDADAGQREAARKPAPIWPPPPPSYPLVPEGCEALYYHGIQVPILPEYWGQEMGPGWSLTPDEA